MDDTGYIRTECCDKVKRIKKVHNGIGWQWHYVCCGWGRTADDDEILTEAPTTGEGDNDE